MTVLIVKTGLVDRVVEQLSLSVIDICPLEVLVSLFGDFTVYREYTDFRGSTLTFIEEEVEDNFGIDLEPFLDF